MKRKKAAGSDEIEEEDTRFAAAGAMEGGGAPDGGEAAPQAKKVKVRAMSQKKLERFNEDQKNRGVVYISRIPPFMKTDQVRRMLGEYGDIDRIYFTPESASDRSVRTKRGGNRKKKFVDGWIEFLDKRVAKATAAALNNTMMGGPKKSRFHDDLWNLRYLSKFKWQHLTERIAYAKQVRMQRMKLEISAAKRETEEYMDQVQQSKGLSKMKERKAGLEKGGSGGGEAGGAQGAPAGGGAPESEFEAMRRKFRQNKSFSSADEGGSKVPAARKKGIGKGLLSRVYG